MKRRLGVLLTVLVLAGSQLYAQSFQLGFKGGGNLSDFISTNSAGGNSYSALAGWNAGAFVNFWLGNHFAIAPEVLYTTQGARVRGTSTSDNATVSINDQLKLRYVSLPIMAK